MSKQLGLLLVREKVITRAQLDEANGGSSANGKNLVFQLLDQHTVDEETLYQFIHEKMGVPAVDFDQLSNIKAPVLRTIARDLADEFSAIPVDQPDTSTLQVAMIDPTDAAAIQEIGFFTGKRIKTMIAPRQIIHAALKQLYNIEKRADGSQRLSKLANTLPDPAPLPMLGRQKQPVKPAVVENPVQQSIGTPFKSPASRTELKPVIIPQTPTPLEVKIPTGPRIDLTADILPDIEIDKPREKAAFIPITVSGQAPPTDPIADMPHISGPPLDALHKKTLSFLDQVHDKEEVAEYFLSFAANILRRVALFTIKKNVLLGWEGRGEDFTKRNLKGIMIPLNSPSIFQKVKDSKVYYLGEVPRSTVNQIFLTALGNVYPPNVLVIPILVRDKVVCIFYADHMLEEIPTTHLHYLHLLTPKIETVFEKLILDAKKTKVS